MTIKPTSQLDLKAIVAPYMPRIIAAFTTERAEVGAQVWREIIAAHPDAETLRKIAFEMSVQEARDVIVKLFPLAAWLPSLNNQIAGFQFEMRRQR
jgi:hypothetical protein